MDKGLQDPSSQLVYGKFEKPVAESKYIVRVKSKVLNWRNFLYFAGVDVDLPGARAERRRRRHAISRTTTSSCCRAPARTASTKRTSTRATVVYDPPPQRLLGRESIGATSGSTTSTRSARPSSATRTSRSKCSRRATSTTTTSTSRASGSRSSNFDRVQRGLIQKRKIFNDNPSGIRASRSTRASRRSTTSASARRSRLLLNRELLIEKLFFNEYVPHEFVLRGGIYENPNNPKNAYDPQRALKLLAEAGWNARDARDGSSRTASRSTIELLYCDKGIRAVAHDLSGGSAQGRHRPEPAARDARNALQARHGAQLRPRVASAGAGCCFRTPRRRSARRSPT